MEGKCSRVRQLHCSGIAVPKAVVGQGEIDALQLPLTIEDEFGPIARQGAGVVATLGEVVPALLIDGIAIKVFEGLSTDLRLIDRVL